MTRPSKRLWTPPFLDGVPLAWLLLAVGCGGYPPAPAYPTATTSDEGFETARVDLPGMPGDVPAPFTLQPGDTISVEIESTERQVVDGVLLDGTGVAHLPFVGDVRLHGVSLTEAERLITTGLREYDRLAQAHVRLTARGGHRATVLGAVKKQGTVELQPAARVTDVIAAAGGALTVTTGPEPVLVANLAGAVIMRQGKRLPVNMELALQGDPEHNVFMRPGDHIYVPPTTGHNITVLGQVGAPKLFAYRSGLRLTEALALGGGVTQGGDKGDIRVIRGTLLEPKVYRASLRELVDGEAHDVALQPGDIVFVTDHAIEDIGEVMAVVSPALSLGLSTALLAITLER